MTDFFTSPAPSLSPETSLAAQPILAGNLEVRLASSAEDLDASQALRYHVFVEEMGAHPSDADKAKKRDTDPYDAVCDPLLVVEHQPDGRQKVVGCYRLLRREPMQQVGQFYTATEFDITPMLTHEGGILELGRSCVHADYRNRAVIQLLWRGITAYVEKHHIDYMFGCGSLHSSDIEQHKETLSCLHHYYLAPEKLRIRALPDLYQRMDWIAKDDLPNPKRIFATLPPLIKGYMRLGGFIGDGAVIDKEYNTTDVAIIVGTKAMTDKYLDRYASDTLKESVRAE